MARRVESLEGRRKTTNRIPPHNLDAEQSVLGAMLESRDAIANVVEIVSAEDFYKPAHGAIFDAVLSLYSRSEPADAITVADELSRRGEIENIGGKPYIVGLLEAYPTASSATRYARIVEEHALLRRLVEAGNQVQEIGFSMPEDVGDAVDVAEQLIYEVGDRRLRDDIQHIQPLLGEQMENIEKLSERGESITGLASGFHDLDDRTSGFQPSTLVILAARPSMGKSALLSDFALSAALRQRQPVVIFNLEMSRQELTGRFLASESKVDSQRLRKGTLQDQDWPRLSAAVGRLADAPIYIDDSANITLMEIRAKCRRLKARHGLGLVIIDYLQLMQSPRRSENRQQEVSEISRSLKILARELEVPIVCASQLNRGVEFRADKRPLLGDLRESGCLTGDTLVTLEDGRAVPIQKLVGQTPRVVTLDGWKMGTGQATKVWLTGHRPVFRLTTASGRSIRATDNHPFRVLGGWRALGDLQVGDRIAVPRTIPAQAGGSLDRDRLTLLAHLIGDGCFVDRQPLHYTTASEANAQAVERAAFRGFGVNASRVQQETWWHLYLSARANRWHPNPIRLWLRQLGIDGQRSHEKFIPEEVFSCSDADVAFFLRHLWATDGCVWLNKDSKGPAARIYYASTSRKLAGQVQYLLQRLGIASRLRSSRKGEHRPSFGVHVDGATEQLRFARLIGAHGEKQAVLTDVVSRISGIVPNTNVDTVPVEVWDRVRTRMLEEGVSQRRMAQLRGTTYGGTSHFRFAPSRDTLASYATLLRDPSLQELAESDVMWDAIVSIELEGTEDVYDMTVPGPHNFVADGIVVHNSIEQDADIVMFIYRDEVYHPESEAKGEAELILAKHRNGPTGTVRLAFMNQYTKFASIARVGSY